MFLIYFLWAACHFKVDTWEVKCLIQRTVSEEIAGDCRCLTLSFTCLNFIWKQNFHLAPLETFQRGLRALGWRFIDVELMYLSLGHYMGTGANLYLLLKSDQINCLNSGFRASQRLRNENCHDVDILLCFCLAWRLLDSKCTRIRRPLHGHATRVCIILMSIMMLTIWSGMDKGRLWCI